MENQLFTLLEVKEAAILHKYMTAAGHQIDAGDEGKLNIFYIYVGTLTNYFFALNNRDQGLGDSSTSRENAHQND